MFSSYLDEAELIVHLRVFGGETSSVHRHALSLGCGAGENPLPLLKRVCPFACDLAMHCSRIKGGIPQKLFVDKCCSLLTFSVNMANIDIRCLLLQ